MVGTDYSANGGWRCLQITCCSWRPSNFSSKLASLSPTLSFAEQSPGICHANRRQLRPVSCSENALGSAECQARLNVYSWRHTLAYNRKNARIIPPAQTPLALHHIWIGLAGLRFFGRVLEPLPAPEYAASAVVCLTEAWKVLGSHGCRRQILRCRGALPNVVRRLEHPSLHTFVSQHHRVQWHRLGNHYNILAPECLYLPAT